ncbi:hypothetical protein HWC35_gp063 [Vibrio phage USC-1]|uniref:Uncharacterized protein n=2 Tax=Aphroditevirus USC1 TaxID=2846605 RepID=A0A514A2E0_9CAUD|nr:hypothetical protein HWC35_gp063 [Vibrio phage USC-1]QCW23271.1 hypothetical protein [Vibrio phage 5 TSL-2019]QDH47457.1 hypothetical protein [Vibrio phage USC-1]
MKNVNKLLAETGINLTFELPETNVKDCMSKICPSLALQILKHRNEILKNLCKYTVSLGLQMHDMLNLLQNSTGFFNRNFNHNIMSAPVAFGETYYTKCVRTLSALTQTPESVSETFMNWLVLGETTNKTLPTNIYSNFEYACSSIGLGENFRNTFSPGVAGLSFDVKKITALDLTNHLNQTSGHYGSSQATQLVEFGMRVTNLISTPISFGTRALDLGDPTPLYELVLKHLGKLSGVKYEPKLISLTNLLLLGEIPKEPILLEPQNYQKLLSNFGVQYSNMEAWSLIQTYVRPVSVSPNITQPLEGMGMSNGPSFCLQSIEHAFNTVAAEKFTRKEARLLSRLYSDFHTREPEYVVTHYELEDMIKLDAYIRPLLQKYYGTFGGELEGVTAWHGIRTKLEIKNQAEEKAKEDTPLAKLMVKSRLQAEELIAGSTPFLFEDRQFTSEEIQTVIEHAKDEVYLLSLLALENQINLEGVFDDSNVIDIPTFDNAPSEQVFLPTEDLAETQPQIKLESVSDEIKVVKYTLERLSDKLKYQGGDLDNVLREYFNTRPISIDTVIRCLVLLPKSQDTLGLTEEIKTTYKTLVAENGTMQIESFPTLGQSIAEALYLALSPVTFIGW